MGNSAWYVLAIAVAATAVIVAVDLASAGEGEGEKGGGKDSVYTPPDATYKVTFDSRGGTPVPPIGGVAKGGRIAEPPAPVKVGYAFGGWYKEVDCVNKWNFTSGTVYGDIYLYARWTHEDDSYMTTYYVKFNSQGGTPVSSVFGVMIGGKVLAPEDPSKRGYIFSGWYREEDCVSKWDFDHDGIEGNTMLFAKWISEYMVAVDHNKWDDGAYY